MMTIQEFCDRHDACTEGRVWALANCRDMAQAWETLRPDWLLWVATRPGVLDGRTLRRFAVWSARQVQHLMTDSRSLAALDVAERYADGHATDEELRAARDAARDAAGAAVWSATRAATRAAAGAAVWSATRAAAGAAELDAELDAELAATRAAAGAAELDAELDAAGAAQAAWLRANGTPNFGGCAMIPATCPHCGSAESAIFPTYEFDCGTKIHNTDWRSIACMLRVGDAAIKRLQRAEQIQKALLKEHEEICQIAGKALGYPWYKDDQKNFPGADESWGVCVGEHVATTIVAELAHKYNELKAGS